MSRIRVMELAKELGLENKVTIQKLGELGIQVTNHFNALSDLDADKLRSYVRTGKNPDKTASEKSNKVVIRRRSRMAESEQDQKDQEAGDKPKRRMIVRRAESSADEDTQAAPAPSQPEVDVPANDTAQTQAAKDAQVEVSEAPEVKPADSKPNVDVSASAHAKSTPSPLSVEEKNFPSQQQNTPPAEEPASPPAKRTPEARPERTASSSGAQIISRRAPTTGGATIIRRADRENGAVIVRKAPAGGSGPVGRSYGPGSGRDDDSRGGYRGGRDDDSRGGYRGGRDDDSRGGYRGGSGGPGGGRPAPGGGGAPGPRGRFGASSGPRPGGAPSASSSGPSVPSLGVLDEEVAGKGAPIRDRAKDKDRDRERRRHQEEESRKKSKGKGLSDVEVELDEEEVESAGVRNFIPQRRRSGRRKDLAKKRVELKPMKASKRVVRIADSISVGALAQEMSVKSSAVIKTLMSFGTLATVNQSLDMETAAIVAQEFGFEVLNTSKSIGDILNTSSHTVAEIENFEQTDRPPVVTIMGHVDHGKTSLLDAIRKSKQTENEAGGITQHIGAYQVSKNGKKITFIDTPGHAAFTEMRARGAQVTDVVILVVAADDGVMPQTIEAINHAKAAEVPIVVAVNKMDKPEANYDKILGEMSHHGVTPEDWGGEAMFVKCSAHTQEGIGDLLDAILLQSDVLELKARTEGLAEGVVIESRLDKARGPVATLLVTKGILKRGESLVVGTSSGRVRALFDDEGQKLDEAGPSRPVEVLGLDTVPKAGDTFNVVASESVAKQAVQYRQDKARKEKAEIQSKTSIQDLLSQLGTDSGEKKSLPVIIKADTNGSVEAIKGALEKLATEKVSCKFVHCAVGGITETDIILGMTSQALVLGFNVRPDRKAAESAEANGVQVEVFSVIYELIETVENAMAGRLEPIRHERIQGHAEVRETFSVPKVGVIAGTSVTDGKFTRSSLIRVIRDGIVIYNGKISSLRRFKDDVKEVSHGYECGIGIEGYNDLKVGDVLESYYIEEVAATLRPTSQAGGQAEARS